MRVRVCLLLTCLAIGVGARRAGAQASQLTVTAPPGGKIGDENQKLECGDGVNRCRVTFPGPTTLKIWAFPNTGYRLGKWIGCTPPSPGSQWCSLTVNGAQTVSYEFVKMGWVSVTISEPAHGVVAFGNDRCPGKCKFSVTKGLQMTFTPIGDPGWVLESWGADCSNRGNPCVLPSDDDKGVAANFKPVGTWTLTVTKPNQRGVIINDDQSLRCGDMDRCTLKVTKNASVRLSGWSNNGARPGPWKGACEGSSDQFCTFVMRSDMTVTRSFVP